MTKEYIEREALIQLIDEKEPLGSWTDSESGIQSALDWGHYRTLVDEMPAADVVEVRHGYWVQGDYYDIGDVCSECEFDSFHEPCHYSYCPHCGAKMDGKDD